MKRSIRATLIKEVRENLRWAGLISLLSFIGLVVGLHDQFNAGLSVLGQLFLTLCMGMYPIAGLSLGLIQIFQDSRAGRWQFVSHRPMSRSRLLGCKIATGITLYLTATMIPLWIITLWVSAPGHVAGPFSWDMIQPAIAYLLGGLIWYATGLLVAIRSARWIGSRLIPLGGAIFGCWIGWVFAWTLTQFIVITLVATIVQLLGALGLFRSSDDTSRTAIWAKPSVAFSLSMGWILALTVCMMLGDSALRSIFPLPARQDQPYQFYHCDKQGQIQILTMDKGLVQKAQTLTGDPLPAPPTDYWETDTASIATISFPDDPAIHRIGIPAVGSGFLQPQNHVVSLGSTSGRQWFWTVNRRTIEAFDQESHAYFGSLGTNGFTNATQEAKPFPPSTHYSALVGSSAFLTGSDSVYLMDLSLPRLSKIFTSPASDPVLAATSTVYETNGRLAKPDPTFTVVVTRSAYHILQDGKPPLTLPLNIEHPKNSVDIIRTSTGQFSIAYGINEPVNMMPVEVSTYDANAKLVARIVRPVIEQPRNNQPDVEECCVLTLAPPAFFATVSLIEMDASLRSWHAIAFMTSSSISYLVIGMILLRLRHSTKAQMWIWLPISAGLGLVGILLLVSMLKFPKAVRCSHCRKSRLVTQERCPHCGVPSPPPEFTGTEIFDDPAIKLRQAATSPV